MIFILKYYIIYMSRIRTRRLNNMKNTITAQLRELGYSNKQIKKLNNHLNYRGMTFSRVTSIERRVNIDGDLVIDFIDGESGEICEFLA